jgi:hypothetical protein
MMLDFIEESKEDKEDEDEEKEKMNLRAFLNKY